MQRHTQIDRDCGSSSTTDIDDPEYDLLNPHDLVQFLIDANIRLVSLRYLMDLREAGRLWPRRQEAEQDLVTMEEIENLKQAKFVQGREGEMPGYPYGSRVGGGFKYSGIKYPVWIYAVSHCWEAQQHPDPFGFQSSRLLNWFFSASSSATIETVGVFHPDSAWLFIDYICLPQYKRTEDEQVSFSRAMKAMHVLYAHAAIWRVIRLEDIAPSEHLDVPKPLPCLRRFSITSMFRCLRGVQSPKFTDIYCEKCIEIYCESTNKVELRPFAELVLNRVPYSQRGWCIAEVQWMSTKESIFGYAPMTPARFRERVKRGLDGAQDGLVLRFTHRDDLNIVVRLQEAVFLKHCQQRTKLYAFDLPLQEVEVLAETLPSFVNLKILRVVTMYTTEADVDLFESCIAILKPVIPLCNRLCEATVVLLNTGKHANLLQS